MKSYSQLKNKYLSDSGIKKSYDALEGEYLLIEEVIKKRIEKKLSQKDLAAKIGTKQSAISRFESGNSNPSLHFLNKIAVALGTKLRISLQ